MVIVRIFYGLGNQMFQYAAARRLAHVLQTDLKLDVSCFDYWKIHSYSLHPFNIREDIATPEETAPFNSVSIESRLGKMWFRLKQKLTLRDWTILYENGIRSVDSRVLNARGDVYLGGYWLSEKYFSDIAVILRREFTIRVEPDPISREIAARIQSCESIGLHVRRGQLAVPALRDQTHGPCCSLEYYHECVRQLADRVRDPHFFVFSDDPDWVVQNVKLEYPVEYVTHNGDERNYEDMRLMSLCRHQITANSSFSWWAAWLNPNPAKIVFAPKQWLHRDERRARDLVPIGWIRV
jgi:hypothetical protein